MYTFYWVKLHTNWINVCRKKKESWTQVNFVINNIGTKLVFLIFINSVTLCFAFMHYRLGNIDNYVTNRVSFICTQLLKRKRHKHIILWRIAIWNRLVHAWHEHLHRRNILRPSFRIPFKYGQNFNNHTHF